MARTEANGKRTFSSKAELVRAMPKQGKVYEYEVLHFDYAEPHPNFNGNRHAEIQTPTR